MIVEMQGVQHRYRRGVTEIEVLRNLDLNVTRGEFVAIMGASGSGKSTLLHILGCLLRPTGGTYRLAGEPVTGRNERDLALFRSLRIGYVFQMFHLLPQFDVEQNVALPFLYQGTVNEEQARSRIDQAIDRVGLYHRRHHRPAELSGGELQRAAVARALVAAPDLILADEPTGNLDERSSVGVLDLFQEMNDDGHAIVLVTHDRDVAVRAGRVVVLRNGVLNDA